MRLLFHQASPYQQFVLLFGGAEGKVNKVEKDYLGVVVLGLFNAAIGVSDIREDLYYEELVCAIL